MRIARVALPLAVIVCLVAGAPAAAAPASLLAATYTVPAPPSAMVQGASAQVSVLVQNSGDELWASAGATPVNLSYHWYDAVGTPVIWEGARTPIVVPVGAGTQINLQANVVAPSAPGVYRLNFAMVKEGVAWFPQSAPFAITIAAPTTSATYAISATATSIGAGGSLAVPVTLTNTSNQLWNATGANPVNLSYHWYDAAGGVVVWEGARTALGGDVAPNTSRTLNAAVTAPNVPGPYTLRLALVREGVAWFPPSGPQPVTALAAYVAAVTPPALPAMIAGGSYTITVPLRNAGAAAWNATGPNLIDVSYHWHDAQGNTVVWDGTRNPLPANVDQSATVQVTMRIDAPSTPGSYTLTIDLVREGVAWFAQLGSTPFKAPVNVAAIRYAATFTPAAAVSAYWAEAKTLAVTVTNSGNVPWLTSGANPVNLSYHIFDAAGAVVVWDGKRTGLGANVAPGASATVSLAYVSPASSGTYTLAIDLVREGIGWFADTGSPASRVPLVITSGLSGGYGATTTPGQVTIGAVIDLSVVVVNYGPRTWPAGGPNPVHLSYHIFGANTGTTYVWDGGRGVLPTDVPPSSQATVKITVAVPPSVGDYVLSWDMVQEGVAWFSQVNVVTKREPFTVVSGVVFYGSGFGHGVGMSQYGANGYATGAAGPALTGEQIIQRYFPGTAFQFGDAARPFNRVLLSQPSTQSRYRCGTNAYFDGYFGDVISNGGFRVLDEGAGNAEIGRAAPNAKWQFVATGGLVRVWNNGGASPVQIGNGFVSVAVSPLDATLPLRFVQKDHTDGQVGFYRGNLRFTNLGNTLRVINAVSYDDYVRGVISFEMPSSWHPEALKAQAYAARSYAYASYRGTARDYDVSDDQSDQCYGGLAAEGPRTDAAVLATAGKLVTYQGGIVKTYFASSSGGYTLEFGCWGNRVIRSGGTWVCTPDATQPALAAVPDPGDRAVTNPPNPRASWSATFSGPQIVNAAICAGGPNIGTLQGADVSNTSPAGVGHVISVRLIGSNGTADVKAETFLQTCLGLRSTMVRLAPF
ncbi:MAG TPA: SpoIID/LytB domain-containing protein [Candidatus Limnocylindria bacterium]